jgi:hypothetical protein
MRWKMRLVSPRKKQQAVITEMQECLVAEIAPLPALSEVCETTSRCVLLVVGLGFSELRGWNGITRSLKKINMSGLQRRLKALSTSTIDSLVISDCLDCLHPFFTFLSNNNVTDCVDGPKVGLDLQSSHPAIKAGVRVSTCGASLRLECFSYPRIERRRRWRKHTKKKQYRKLIDYSPLFITCKHALCCCSLLSSKEVVE